VFFAHNVLSRTTFHGFNVVIFRFLTESIAAYMFDIFNEGFTSTKMNFLMMSVTLPTAYLSTDKIKHDDKVPAEATRTVDKESK
jgi:hypothetical protein